MFCIKCGTQNEPNSAFCINCGSRLTPTEKPASAPKAAPKASPKAAPKTAPKATPKAPAPKTAPKATPKAPAPKAVPQQPVVQVNNNFNAQQQTQVQAPTQEGVLTAAWHDITSTPGWFKKVLLMALFNMIPFLDLGTIGYSQKWGVEVVKGNRSTMPQQIFNNRNFLTGLMEKVTWIALGFVYIVGAIVAGTLLGSIPILGILLVFAIAVFAWFFNSFIALCSMKTALHNELGESFRIKKILDTFKKNIGGVFSSYILPALLCGLICSFVITILVVIFSLATAGTIGGITSMFGSRSSSNPLYMLNNFNTAISAISSLASLGLTLAIIGGVIIAAVVCLMGAFEKLLRYRALGHWISRYAPEWINEHEEHSTVKKE